MAIISHQYHARPKKSDDEEGAGAGDGAGEFPEGEKFQGTFQPDGAGVWTRGLGAGAGVGDEGTGEGEQES